MTEIYAELKQYDNLISVLRSGSYDLNLELFPAVQEKLIKYIMLLHKWNQTFNLTAIRDPGSILIRHIFDSLSAAPFIIGANILDFGTGAGLPGIPLALVLPQYNFVLLDIAKKKTTFLNHVKFSLHIENIHIITSRIEHFRFASGFDTIITRATAALDVIIKNVGRLCTENGQILVMKGKYPIRELENVTKKVKIHRIRVPYLDEERHLIKING